MGQRAQQVRFEFFVKQTLQNKQDDSVETAPWPVTLQKHKPGYAINLVVAVAWVVGQQHALTCVESVGCCWSRSAKVWGF